MFRFGDPGGRGYGTVGTNQANLLAWWTGLSVGASNFSVQSGGGRTTGSSLRIALGPNRAISKTFDAQPTWGAAFGVKMSAFTAQNQLISASDSGTLQTDIITNTDGTISARRGATVLGTTVAALSANVYAHIEWLVTINNTAGSVQLWINGISALNLTSQNTRVTANNSANQIYLGNNGAGGPTGTIDYDDVIIYDGQTTDPQGNLDIHGQIGDCGLTWLLPTAAGTTTQFTPDLGANYSRINEATPDGDTSYVASNTVGQIDTYTMADLPVTAGSVKSIATMHYVRKDDTGSRSFAAELRTNSANFQHTNTYSTGNNYTYFFSNWGLNPSGTPAAWTPTSINAIEIGQQVTA